MLVPWWCNDGTPRTALLRRRHDLRVLHAKHIFHLRQHRDGELQRGGSRRAAARFFGLLDARGRSEFSRGWRCRWWTRRRHKQRRRSWPGTRPHEAHDSPGCRVDYHRGAIRVGERSAGLPVRWTADDKCGWSRPRFGCAGHVYQRVERRADRREILAATAAGVGPEHRVRGDAAPHNQRPDGGRHCTARTAGRATSRVSSGDCAHPVNQRLSCPVC